MGTRMLYQCWINVELRRRRCVEKMLDLQIGSTSKRRRCIDVAVSTHFKRRSYVVFTLNVRAMDPVRGEGCNPAVPPPLLGFGAPNFWLIRQ